ncbi:MAG TPA: Ig-like domain-containing protein [Bacteroidales bacterium]|nr:Ig-like domain-containing protein [Bacteroidales bacterium]
MRNSLVITAILVLLFQGCAKIGQPTGGPKDVYPPEFIGSNPPNHSVNFSGDQVDIEFNEFIQLKDQNKEILVSPPMKEKPLIRVRDKSIRVTFNEELQPQSTYTLNFGKSLSDLNEGNLLPDFEYVVSTGSSIDSLSVTGTVTDAFTLKAGKDVQMLVMLYENLSDSAPLIEIPKYYGRANENGLFAVNNIHPDTFRVIALQDANNNLMYDPGIENIAFLDSFLVINSSNVHRETFIKDTVKIITDVEKPLRKNKQDTTRADTIIAPGKVLNAVSITLNSFIEENSKVFITARERKLENKFMFSFNRPLFDSLQIQPLNFRASRDWIIPEPSVTGDTIDFWVKDTVTARMDTFLLRLTYTTTDSTGSLYSRSDTIKLRKSAGEKGERGGRRRNRDNEKEENAKTLILNALLSGRSTHDLNSPLRILSSTPVESIQPDSIVFLKKSDTVFVATDFKIEKEGLRKVKITNRWDESTQYKILLKPGSIRDIYGFTNDSTDISFSTQSVDYYGNILLTLSSSVYPIIVQVTNEKGYVVRTAVARHDGLITFDFMPPGKYGFKAIYDRNDNGQWDTGNYLKHIQPEKVYIAASPQELRSNWDMETSWTIPSK